MAQYGELLLAIRIYKTAFASALACINSRPVYKQPPQPVHAPTIT